MNSFIRLLYSLLVAVAVVLFIGVGIHSFYQPPKAPEYPEYSHAITEEDSQLQEKQFSYDQQYKRYSEDQKQYHRNVTLMLLPAAALATVGGIRLLRRNEIIGEGLALGGIATSIYAVITASMGEAPVARFVAVSILLAGTLLLVQRRFNDQTGVKTTKPKKRG